MIKDFELEKELKQLELAIDIDRLAKSNIKQIIIPLHRFIEWRCLDNNDKPLRKTQIFDSCLSPINAKKAKTLNRLLLTHIWNLLDEDVKKDMDFEDFVS